MANRQSKPTDKLSVITLILFVCFASYCIFNAGFVSKAFAPNIEITPTPRPKAMPQKQRAKYSEFSHSTRQHKLNCNSCHKFPTANWNQVRKNDEAFPDVTDYPKHESCLNCHRQQFFKGLKPAICTICHTNPTPRDSSRHPFPNPREIFDSSAKGQQTVSDFAISFPHDKHIDIVGKNKNQDADKTKTSFAHLRNKRMSEGESCSVCHQTYKPQGESDDEYVTKPPAKLGDAFWLKKGTFKTSPISHTQCFNCHSQDIGINPMPNNCAACHSPKQTEIKTDFETRLATTIGITDKIILTAWRERDSSATFRHEWFSHAELSCTTCHNVIAMNTTIVQTKKVKILSCGGGGSGCHITPTSDDGGILNLEIDFRKTNTNYQCVKCHIIYGKSFIPESHTKAISAITKK